MRTLQGKRGFTLIELLVVIAIIALLAAILFPVFAKAQAKAKQTSCLSNVRQMTTAMIMFVQDNKHAYPSVSNTDLSQTWAAQLESYVGNRKIFTCPTDDNGAGYVSYVMNGALVDPNGNGIKDSAVKNPSEVGLFVDGTSYKFPEAGVLNWTGDSHGGSPSAFVARHSYCLSYVDGHADSIGGDKNQNTDSINSPVANAFFQAGGFGWISNPGAGTTVATGTTNGAFAVRGSTTCQPVWDAAAAGWVAGGGSQPDIYLTGSGDYATGDVGGRSSVGSMTASDIIAKDAVAIVVSTSTRINLKSITSAQVKGLLEGSANPVGSQAITLYQRCTADDQTIEGVLCKKSGTFDFIKGWSGAGTVLTDGQTNSNISCKQVASTASLLAKLGGDPYGIGYASVGEADPTKVTILAIKTNSGNIQKYDRAAVEATDVKFDSSAHSGNAEDANRWSLTRYLYAALGSPTTPGDTTAATAFLNYVKGPFQNSLLFKSMFFSKGNPLP